MPRLFARNPGSIDRAATDLDTVLNSALFDPLWYQTVYPDIGGSPIDATRHYLDHGAGEGRDPHPLFSTSYYLAENADVAASGMNPLVHYITIGGSEHRSPHPLFDPSFYASKYRKQMAGANPLEHYLSAPPSERLDPNAFFDADWYLARNPDVGAAGTNPLVHYVTAGEANGFDPSERFDIDWYLKCNIDVARAGVSPLRHYLQSGHKEGRLPSRAHAMVGQVTDATIDRLKAPSRHDEVALFVAHSPDGHLKPHVRHYLESLRRNGVAVVLIVAADAPFRDADRDYVRALEGVFVRENHGFDFAAWAHVLRLHPELLNADIVYLLNDSVIGPTNEALFVDLLRRVRASAADFVGLMDSHEANWHLQSFFLAFKRGALSSAALRSFVEDIVSFSIKTAVIADYELGLASRLMSAGLSCDVVFPQETSHPVNRTLFHWKSLMEAGFPFVKVSTIRDGHPDADTRDWAETLAAHGYDVAIARRTISGAQVPVVLDPVGPAASAVTDVVSPDGAFDADFYLTVYPDIAAAGVDPHDHFVKHGRAEGRFGRLPAPLDALNDDRLLDGGKETVLVLSHEGVRGGAPVLAFNIVERLLKKYNVIVLFLSDGPMLGDTREIGALVVGPVGGLGGSPELAEVVVKRICEAATIRFAIVNTIASRYVLPALARRFVPTVTLVHEFAAYIRPRNAFSEATFWSGEVVFSTEITRDNAVALNPELKDKIYPIVSQGRCVLPNTGVADHVVDDAEWSRVTRLLRPRDFPADGIVVIGAGFVEFRKGVDLFIDCAARVLRSEPKLPIRFVWVGRGYNPDTDVGYSVYLADQVRRCGIEKHFTFLDEVSDLAPVYENADLFMLSSRLDPLPNVGIDALSVGLPVVCFAGTTGIADVLTAHGLADRTVAAYLDTAEMADKLLMLARSKEQRVEVSLKSTQLARAAFNLDAYVAKIEELALRQARRADQEREDVATIVASGLAKPDFYLSPGQQPGSPEGLVRNYVRSWASGIGRRKLFPGFHPGIYRERHGVATADADPLADYIRAGRPSGLWTSGVVTPAATPTKLPSSVRIALHIHAYHLDVVPEILRHLSYNSVRPDLLISVKSEAARQKMHELCWTYRGGKVDIRLVPDPGRDVGPFLTEFGQVMLDRYDLIGHVHTKTSADLADSNVGRIWTRFLLENALGGVGRPMADIILGRMVDDPKIGIAYPDDPHPVGWDDNERFVTKYLPRFRLKAFPRSLHIPVGAFFWARPEALRPMFALGLDWADYPVEPLPYDGSLLHGLERLYGLSVDHAGFEILNTYVPGVTR